MNSSSSTDHGLEHERFCLPRPGELERRIETFLADRDVDGATTHPRVTRCVECGSQRVDG